MFSSNSEGVSVRRKRNSLVLRRSAIADVHYNDRQVAPEERGECDMEEKRTMLPCVACLVKPRQASTM